MLFDNNNVDLDFTFLNLAGLHKLETSTEERNLLSAKEGFLRGNMFKNEYVPYKDLTYINIVPQSNREAKLYNVMAYSFAINDLNLYLDIHPDDKSKIIILEQLIEEEKKAKMEYVKEFGPLDICDTKGTKFAWIDSPWPWDNLRGDIYV